MRRFIARIVCGTLIAAGAVIASPQGSAVADGGSTTRVSVSSSGAPAAGYSDSPVISADGATVVFLSQSLSLNPDAIGGTHIYAHDRSTGRTVIVDRKPDGTAFPRQGVGDYYDVSADGRYVAFTAADGPFVSSGPTRPGELPRPPRQNWNLFRRDLVTGTTVPIGVPPSGQAPDNNLYAPAISGDGNLVAFGTSATNLLDDGKGGGVFVREVDSGTTRRLAQGYVSSVDLSTDGATAVFNTRNSTDPSVPVTIWTADTATGQARQLIQGSTDESYDPTISADGQRVVFMAYGTGLDPSDTNDSYDWFLADRTTGTVRLLNRDTSGNQVQVARASLADDGVHVGMLGGALDDQAVDGVAGLYVLDTRSGERHLAAVDSTGTALHEQINNGYHYLSADARVVTWASPSRGWVPEDTDDEWDVFVHDDAVPSETASGTGTVSTDTEGDGATYLDPIETTVTAPTGPVTITEQSSSGPVRDTDRLLGAGPAGADHRAGRACRTVDRPGLPCGRLRPRPRTGSG